MKRKTFPESLSLDCCLICNTMPSHSYLTCVLSIPTFPKGKRIVHSNSKLLFFTTICGLVLAALSGCVGGGSSSSTGINGEKEIGELRAEREKNNAIVTELNGVINLCNERINANKQQLTLIVIRQFDGNKFECLMNFTKTIVLESNSSTIGDHVGTMNAYSCTVISLGRKPTTVTKSNAFRTWETTEYYDYFEDYTQKTVEIYNKTINELKQRIENINQENQVIDRKLSY